MNQLFEHKAEESEPVECLGKTFPSDEARREHFLKLLAEKLKDPEFRKLEGFPEATDEAILEMSDPPFFTACPNPWLTEFVEKVGKPYSPEDHYSREPLAIDVSVGKTSPIYKAHAYHTKVPHLAIVPSLLHYTNPGDVVLDGFCGSGMTGVAAQWCEKAPATYKHEIEISRKQEGRSKPRWGPRHAILNDLSPAATFIAGNYNLRINVDAFNRAAQQLLKATEQEIGWMYETLHSDGITKGRIEYTVWSQIYSCPECAGEINFSDEALDKETKRVKESFPCPHCGVDLKKSKLNRLYSSSFDQSAGKMIQTPRRAPSIICYKIDNTRYEKNPSDEDLKLLKKIEGLPLPENVPAIEIPEMHMTHERARMDYSGITHVHHFYLPRASQAMGVLWKKANAWPDARIRSMLKFFIEQGIRNLSVLNAFEPLAFSQNARGQKGVYYVPAQHSEVSPWYFYKGKLKTIEKAASSLDDDISHNLVTTGSATNLSGIPDSSIDYIFTDPPFGENIYYADLNFLVEAWHGVKTEATPEAIIDRFKKKGLPDYQTLMQRCFTEYNRVLKPGRWMTVVFSNSKAAVWNAIQVALQQAGFVVAEVTALDKKQGSYRQMTSTTAVKQDLIISAYKPNGGLEKRFQEQGATPDSAWDFVQTHLKQLPTVKVIGGELEFIVERDPRRIFDRMVAWFIRHDAPVPLSSDEFLKDLKSKGFAERDGMIFLPEQVSEYEKKRAQVDQPPQIELFVSDERSAIDWLTDFLRKRPSTYQETFPEFTTQIGAGWKKHEAKPELKALLEDNFIKYDGNGDVPSQIHSYLSTNHKDFRGLEKDDPRLIAKAKGRWYVPDPNKAQDLEKKREKVLLKEFQSYLEFTGRRLKELRLEVLRAGFKDAYSRKEYQTIVSIAKKIPEESLQEDEKLLLWYDQALTRTEADN